MTETVKNRPIVSKICSTFDNEFFLYIYKLRKHSFYHRFDPQRTKVVLVNVFPAWFTAVCRTLWSVLASVVPSQRPVVPPFNLQFPQQSSPRQYVRKKKKKYYITRTWRGGRETALPISNVSIRYKMG
jgi:hypothetical protein